MQATKTKLQANVITAAQYTFTVTGKHRPFSNNFTMQTAEVIQWKGVDELHCTVLCNADSNEPGRLYFCAYSTQGKLIECITLN